MSTESIVGGAATLLLGLLATGLLWAVKVYSGQTKDVRVRAMIQTFVEAAEQLYQSESGTTKLEWVFGELRKQFPGLDAGLLRAMIEQAVLGTKWMQAGETTEEVRPSGHIYWSGGASLTPVGQGGVIGYSGGEGAETRPQDFA